MKTLYKVKGAVSRCLSWHLLNMAWLKVKQGHFETAIVILHNVLSPKTASGVLKHYIKYLHDSKLCTVLHLFKGSQQMFRKFKVSAKQEQKACPAWA